MRAAFHDLSETETLACYEDWDAPMGFTATNADNDWVQWKWDVSNHSYRFSKHVDNPYNPDKRIVVDNVGSVSCRRREPSKFLQSEIDRYKEHGWTITPLSNV